jgi:hypothetical protein
MDEVEIWNRPALSRDAAGKENDVTVDGHRLQSSPTHPGRKFLFDSAFH